MIPAGRILYLAGRVRELERRTARLAEVLEFYANSRELPRSDWNRARIALEELETISKGEEEIAGG